MSAADRTIRRTLCLDAAAVEGDLSGLSAPRVFQRLERDEKRDEQQDSADEIRRIAPERAERRTGGNRPEDPA